MTSALCSSVHLRLVKNLSGQPPSGAIVPSLAPAPKFMPQVPPFADVKTQRPSITGGGDEACPAEPVARSADAQPASQVSMSGATSGRSNVFIEAWDNMRRKFISWSG
jgi:hypothetical protein